MTKRIFSFILAVFMLCTMLPQIFSSVNAVTALPNSIYITQSTDYTCTLASITMMIRARMYLSGNDDWNQITESSMRPVAWREGDGALWEFTYSSSGSTISTFYKFVSGISTSDLKAVLDNHPEGIVAYSGNRTHAVLITDYEGDRFYCADPAGSYSGKRIPLGESYLAVKCGGGQDAVLRNITVYSYVSSYSIVPTCNHANRNNVGYCPDCKTVYNWDATFSAEDAGIYKVTKSGGIQLRTERPYDASAAKSELIKNGIEVEVLGAVYNHYKEADGTYHKWYKVSYNGVIGYTYHEHLTKVSSFDQQISCTVSAPVEGETVPKAVYHVTGSITSRYPLKEVIGEIDGSEYTRFSTGNVTTLDIQPSGINQHLSFGSLPSGKHTLTIKARDIYHDNFVTVCTRNFITEGDAVDTRTPGKPVLECSTNYYDNSPVTFTWAATANTTHYNMWIEKKSASGKWEAYEWLNYTSSGVSRTLPMGEYRFELQSYNSNAWNSDGSDWLYTVGDIVYLTIQCAHSYTSTVTRQPTCANTGIRTYICSKCNHSYTETISATGNHTFVDGLCTSCGTVHSDYVIIEYDEYYSKIIKKGEVFTIDTAPSRFGYNFTGWQSQNSGIVYQPGDLVSFSQHMVMTACWEAASDNLNYSNFDTVKLRYSNQGYYMQCTPDGSRRMMFWSDVDGLDPMLTIYDANGNQLATNDDGGEGRNFCLEYEVEKNKTYYLYVEEWNGRFGEFYILADTIDNEIWFWDEEGVIAVSYNWELYGVKQPEVTPIREGYEIMGWSMEQNATTATYPATGRFCLPGDIELGIVVNLYPVWRQTNGTCGDNLTWALDNDGTLTISGTGMMYDYNGDNTPWCLQNARIKKVVIKNGVTNIGDGAFYECAGLTSVLIPNSVTTIGKGAFFNCSKLTGVILPDSVTSIDIGAFTGCASLTSIAIPEKVVTIGAEAFALCDSLTGIWVSEKNNKYSSDISGVLFNKEQTSLIHVPGGFVGNYTVPSSVTSIQSFACFGCSKLTGVVIPNGVTYIRMDSFRDCNSLTHIAIPASVTNIATFAVSGCPNLSNVYYAGTQAQWNDVSVGENNDPLLNATLHTVEPECAEHTWDEWIVETEATRTETGSKYHVCTVCGEREDKVIPQTLRMSGAGLTLSDGILLSVKMPKTTVDSFGYTDAYLQVVLNGTPYTVTEYRADGNNYVFDFAELSPAQLGDVMDISLHATFDGEAYATAVTQYSVWQYCQGQLTKSTSTAALKTLLVDMLNYGAAAQQYVDYKLDDLITDRLTAEQKAWGTQADTPAVNELKQAADNATPTVQWKGGKLLLGQKVTVVVTIQVDNLEGFAVVMTDAYGNEYTYTAEELKPVSGYTDRYTLEIGDLGVGQMRDAATFVAYQNGVQASKTLTYSIQSYVATNGTGTRELAVLLRAMLRYGDAAKAYAVG